MFLNMMSSNVKGAEFETTVAGISRPLSLLILAVSLATVAVIGHFMYGANLYDDPSREHVVAPALVIWLISVVLAGLYFWRPGPALLGLLIAEVDVFYIGLFGVYHGAINHGLKLILFFGGMDPSRLAQIFESPDFRVPDDVLFELSGLSTFVIAVAVAHLLVRLHRFSRSRTAERRAKPIVNMGGLALRMLVDAPLKSLGTLLGVIVSAFLMLQQMSLLLGILARVTGFADAADVDIWIASAATESTDATDSVPASRVGAAASTPGVAWAAPVVQGVGRVTRPDGVREFVKVLGVEPPRYAGLPRALSLGTTREALRASDRLFLNANDRPTFAAAVPGDRVEVNGRAGVVAGFFEGMDPHSPYYYFYANIDDARSMTDFPQDRVTYVAVGVETGARVEDVKRRIAARAPDVTIFSRKDLHDAETRYFLARNPVGIVFGMGTVVAAFIGAAIVAITLYSTVVDRTRDYGMLKAIGARKRDLLQLLFLQAWSFALIGYAVGAGAFFLVRHAFPNLPMLLTPGMLAGVALAAFVSCTLASLVAARRVLALDAAIVFRG
jgi:putative ABC transport system permease protein